MPRSTTALVVPVVGGPFELRRIELNALQPDEALVEIHYTGICHTDIACASGKLPCKDGAVLGHEGAGIVLEVGDDVTSTAAGDKVLLSFSHCETCPPCKSGHPAYCHSFNERNFGGTRPDGTSALAGDEPQSARFSSFFGQSSFARQAIVHKSSLVRVPQDVDLGLLAPLGCGIQTGMGAILNTLDVTPGSSVAVFGVGSVGIASLLAAKLRGAEKIIAIDVQESRLRLAMQMGATHGILNSPNIVRDARAICPPVGVDFAVECTGVKSVIRDMMNVLGTRGKGATVGAPGFGTCVAVDVMDHLTYGKTYVGCCEGDSLPAKFIPYLIELRKGGKLRLEDFVTVYSIRDYARAVSDSSSGAAVKAVLKWEDLELE